MKKLFMFFLVICGLVISSLSLTSCDHDDVPSLKTDTTNKSEGDNEGNNNPSLPGGDVSLPPETGSTTISNPNSLFTQSDLDWLNEIIPTLPSNEKEEISYTLASEIDVTVDERVKTANLCSGTLLIATFTNVNNKLVLDDGYDGINLASDNRYMMTFDYVEIGTKLKTISSITSNEGDVVSLSANKTFVQLQISDAVSFTITTESKESHDEIVPYVSSSTISIEVDKNVKSAKIIRGTETIVEFDVEDGMLVAKKHADLIMDKCYSLVIEFTEAYDNRVVIDEIIEKATNATTVFKSVNNTFANIYFGPITNLKITTRVINTFVSVETINIGISDNIKGAKLYLDETLIVEFGTNKEALYVLPEYQDIKLETKVAYKLVFEYKEDNLKITNFENNNSNNSTVVLYEDDDCLIITLGSYTDITVEAA